jgi:sugar lactone lactonase YvrE
MASVAVRSNPSRGARVKAKETQVLAQSIRIPSILGVFVLLAAVLATGAAAHPGHPHKGGFDGRLAGQPDFKKIGKTTYRFNDNRDEYEILQGNRPTSFAHVDPTPQSAKEVAGGPGVQLPANERNPICRTSGNRIVPVFTHRVGDGTPTPTATIQSIVKRMNWKINQQSSASSGGSRAVDMVVDCNGSGEINVYNVASSIYSLSSIDSALSSQLFGKPDEGNAVKYLAFDTQQNPDAVGIGQLYSDTLKWSYNSNGKYSATAVIYNYPAAWTSHVTLHEFFHTLGATQGMSPNPPPYASTGAHCIDGLDMLCYADGTSGTYTETRCSAAGGFETPTTVPIDCGNDTYFDSAASGGSWLAQKWNTGEFENPFLIVPGPPKATTMAVTSTGGTTATLKGRVNAGGYAASYQFEYGKTASYGTKAPVSSQAFGFNVREVDVTQAISGLESGTEYHYRVLATNSAGTSYGPDMTFKTNGPPTVSTNPASVLGTNKATFTGSFNAEGGFSCEYSFEYGTTTSYGSSTSVKYPACGKTTTSVSETVEGLKASTTYHFRLRGKNGIGSVYSSDRAFTTSGQAVTKAATSVTALTALLNGSIFPQGVATTYQFEYGRTTGYGSKIPASPQSAGASNEEVKVVQSPAGLTANATYHYRVVATNELGTYYGEDKEFTTLSTEVFGSGGTGAGQFESPKGIALDSSGNVWVADTGNNRIQKFNSKGEFLLKFGSAGTGSGQFNQPSGVAIDGEGKVWIADTGNHRVQRFTAEGGFLSSLGSKGAGSKEFESPTGIVARGTSIIVADTGNNRIRTLESSKGVYSMSSAFGSKGSGNGQFEAPQGIAVHPELSIWVAEAGNHRIQHVSSFGSYYEKAGSEGTGSGQFKGPYAVAVDIHGKVWVADTGNNRIQKWYPAPRKPFANAEAVLDIAKNEATIAGRVWTNGLETTYQFEYGRPYLYWDNTLTPVTPESVGSEAKSFYKSVKLTGLASGTEYYFRIKATNSEGTTTDQEYFTTKSGPGTWLSEGQPLEWEGATFAFSGGLEMYDNGDALYCEVSGEAALDQGAKEAVTNDVGEVTKFTFNPECEGWGATFEGCVVEDVDVGLPMSMEATEDNAIRVSSPEIDFSFESGSCLEGLATWSPTDSLVLVPGDPRSITYLSARGGTDPEAFGGVFSVAPSGVFGIG